METEADLALVVVPVYNDEDNIFPLRDRIVATLDGMGNDFEVVFINDGSTDATEARLREVAGADARFKIVTFRRNFGQTAAIMAGIEFASGEIIVGLDGDLQNDPADIPRLVQKLSEGYDVVSGWRLDRKDAKLRRNLLSRLANWLISRISSVHLHDYGCTLKAYKRQAVKDLRLYGEMHRFIPIYATWQGGKVTEIPVKHHARLHGHSKYGLERVVKVLLDLLVVKFLANYATKPIYVFGGFGIVSIAISFLSGIWAVYLKLFEQTSFISTLLPLLVVLTFITGVMSILMGLLAEIISSLLWFVPRQQFRLLTPDANAGTYLFNKHVIEHRFCRTCGIHAYASGVDPAGKAMAAINIRCLEDLDLSTVPITQFDGRSV